MSKILLGLLAIALTSMALATTITAPMQPVARPAISESACQVYRQQMRLNHKIIDAAYEKKDACTMGKLMIQNRQIFESHQACFPVVKRRAASQAV